MRNQDVVLAWYRGQDARSYNGNLHCENGALFSYQLRIGQRLSRSQFEVYDYRGPHRISMTTTHHVGLADRLAYRVPEICRELTTPPKKT